MVMWTDQGRRSGRRSRRVAVAFATAAALGVSTLVAAQPAAAAEDPWVTEVDNVVPDEVSKKSLKTLDAPDKEGRVHSKLKLLLIVTAEKPFS